jgi:LPS sulfotransferase NodH
VNDFPFDYPVSDHERKIEAFFARFDRQGGDRNPVPNVKDGHYSHYVICFMNRSGSNLLARALMSTGRFGLAQELFNHPRVSHFARSHGVRSLPEYATTLRRCRATANGVFGTKLAWSQLYYLTKVGVIPKIYGNVKYILIERRDVLGQAISYAIADQTKAWNSKQEVEGVDYKFDPEDILNRIRGLTDSYARFKAYFAAYDIQPVYVTYEELDGDVSGAVARVIKELAIPGTELAQVDMASITLRRQRGPLNLKVRREFLSHTSSG